MVLYILSQLILTPVYCWFYLWQLGYHGAFLVILTNIALSGLVALNELLLQWMYDAEYIINIVVWIEFGNCNLIHYAVAGNFISSLVLVIMTCGAFIVLIFVYVEMWDDKEGANFAILLMLFLGFMGILAASANIFMFYLGWEGIGLTSLFLISFWSERARAIKATLKVYTINKIGDFLLLVGIALIFIHIGIVDFNAINAIAPLVDNYYVCIGNSNIASVEAIATFLVIGGGVKSAQFGFHIWLLEAMEAPLGASALMHSSTLVIAGVVLTFKLASFIELSLIATIILVTWGAWTTLFASFVACFQFELKIILAYSTISSMGFLYCLLGLHAYSAAINYLVIHAFIKIFLFLIIGAIMLHCNGCQDVRWMGGLLHYIPSLYIFYIVGAASMAGLPYLSGYYCKSAAWFVVSAQSTLFNAVQLIFLLTTLCTYTYLTRLGILIFFGPKNGHRSIYRTRPQSILVTIAFWVLSILAAYSGALWTHMCATTAEVSHASYAAAYELITQVLQIQTYTSWWLLTATYSIAITGIYIMSIILTDKKWSPLRYTYYIFIIALSTQLIYICMP